MLITASQTSWQEISSGQNYYGEQSCAQCSSYTKHSSTGRHWPTPYANALRSVTVKKPRNISLNDLVKIVERYECAAHNSEGRMIVTGEPEDLVRALSRLATLAQ